MPALLKPAMEAANVDNLAELSVGNGILYGKFLATLIDFAIVAFVVYFLVVYLKDKFKSKKSVEGEVHHA